ncbi:reverse transcriptase domain-containing protein [Tanacetum coccineum]
MKLNPKKYSFGMGDGKFLGYIVTSEGIRANPEKIKAVMDSHTPKTLKQMQSLSGKLEALNRFLSKSDERSLPFLDTLKKYTNKKDFRWTEAAEAAFLEMKKMVYELPTLTTLNKGETLMMYLAAENEAVSVKGQVLADFLADTPTKINATPGVTNNPRVEDIQESSNARENLTPGPRAWSLYTDGASNNEGSGAGLILIAPDDVEYSYVLRLNFSNFNNNAEYEALLTGLRIAKEMQVKDIHAFVDSKLVASQVEGSYEAKGERMIKYREKADALSKLAAVQFDYLSKEVLVEVLNERSKGKLPEDPVDARTLMEKIGNYTMEYGVLYRKCNNHDLSRVDGRSYLLSGATNSSEANGIIRNPKLELESFCFTFDLVPLSCGKRLYCLVGRKFLFDELRDRVVNDVVTQPKVLTSFFITSESIEDFLSFGVVVLLIAPFVPGVDLERKESMMSKCPLTVFDSDIASSSLNLGRDFLKWEMLTTGLEQLHDTGSVIAPIFSKIFHWGGNMLNASIRENKKADALSKLAAIEFDHLSKEVLVEVLNERSVEAQEVNMVVEEKGPTWMTSIRNYLKKGILLEDPVNARTLMEKIRNYTMEDGVLYGKSYLVPLMRCVGPLQANYVIKEMHMGSCGMHDGPRQVVAKTMNLGYYWPSMHRDARELIRTCDDCQAHASIHRLPKANMISVVNFTWDDIICRFRISATIITDNGTQFVNDPFKKWVEKLKIPLISTSVYHPQGNEAVERANISLLRGIKTRLEKGGSAWDEEVPNVLWEHQTIKKTSNGETPFSLTYGIEAVILELRLNLNLLEERREIAAIKEARYKQQVEKYYNKKVRHVQFKVGEFVLRKKNKALRVANTGKLGPTWEEPYIVIQAFQSGAYKLSNMEGKRYLGPGMLVASEGATCKAPEYLYFY